MNPAPDGDAVETYLDELTGRLHGSPAQVRRVVAECAEHLRDATDAYVGTGLSADEAGIAAVRDFGSAAEVAATMNRTTWAHSRRLIARDATEALLGVAAIAMLVVGTAGVAARLLAAVTSTQTVFGLPSGASVSTASCAHWLAVQPTAATCQQAGTLEAAGDLTRGMVGTGLLGLLLLGALVVVRRRPQHASVLPPMLAPTVAATAFGAATVGLAALAASNAVVLATWGQGLWWVCAGCSFVAAIASVVLATRRITRGLATTMRRP